MSLNQLANHMSAQGRGPDSTLVHMSPREVSGLQSLAMAHGGTLTINPQTGLPEAGFLDSLLPTLLGGAATYLTGGAINPLMAAMGVGGLTALTSKDLGKGLMAGLGAYGGGSIVSGLAEFGTGALSAEAGKAAVPSGMDALGYEAEQLSQNAVASKLANASYYDKIAAGASKAMSEPMNALSAIGGGSKFKGAAMLGAPLLSALSTQEATPAPTFQQTQFDPRAANVNIRREQRPYQPDTGSSAQRGYFGTTYIDQYADGGVVEQLASGGVPLDPNYDYSGYGRKNTTRPVPVVQPKALAKPDFVGADGKTYRYDPAKKSWYVFKDAPAKTNPGVAVLMGDQGGEGGAGDYGGKGPYGGNSINAFTNSPLGAAVGKISNPFGATQLPAPVEDKTGTPVNFNTDPNTGVPNTDTNTGTTGMNTGTTGGSPAQAGDIGNPGGPGVNSAQAQAQAAERDTQDARAEINAAPAAPTGIATLGSAAMQLETDAQAQRAAIADARAATEKTFDPFEGISKDVAARAAAEGKTTAAFAEEGLAAISAQAQAQRAAIADARAERETANAKADKDAQAAQKEIAAEIDRDFAKSVFAPTVEDDAGTPVGTSSITGASLDTGGQKAGYGASASDKSGIAALDTAPAAAPTAGPTAAPAADVSGIAALDAGPTAAPEVTGPSAGDYGGPTAAPEVTGPSAGDYGGPSAAPEAAAPEAAPEAAAPEAAAPEAAGPESAGSESAGSDGGDGGGDGGGGEGEANGGMVGQYSQGGLGSLGGYSDGGRLLRGPGDGVSDHIPATIGRGRQPARLADGEFVVPARIVSELGNGSTEAGARALYKMMDRIQANRRKTTGKNSVAVDSKARKYLPA